jgi:carbon-monoxide dehydrogenase iron sulfur subunit
VLLLRTRNLLYSRRTEFFFLEGWEKPMPKIDILENKCTGCRLCEGVCSARLVKNFDSARSAVYVESLLPEAVTIRPLMCIHCEEHPCVDACPVGALEKSAASDLYIVNKDLCTGCGACAQACPYRGIRLDPVSKTAIKCDLCNGQPRCVDICPFKVIQMTG